MTILMVTLLVISLMAGNVYAAASSKAADFKDVPKTAWYYDYVMCLTDRGVVQGYGDTGEFRPTNPVVREHAAKMVVLAAELNYEGKKADFPDVDKDGEMSPYIAALVEKGAVQGFVDGGFKPQGKIKRSHAAKIIQIAFGLEHSTKVVDIIDLANYDAELAEVIEILASNGVVKGYSDSNLFKPDDEINRAEFAKMLCIALVAKAVQEAEDLGTPDAINQAQALVERMPEAQDANTKDFLQSRLDAVKEPAGPDPVKVTGIEIDQKKPGEDILLMTSPSLQLSATITPANATNKKVIWSSDDESCATVDENGLVTKVSKGDVTITVTTEDGGKTDSIDIVVPIIVKNATELEDAVNNIAEDRDVIYLMPGLYKLTENLEITKSVSLIGPQADVDPRPSKNSARASEVEGGVSFNDDNEAVLTGARTGDSDETPSLKYLIIIKAHNVTINGLTMERTFDNIIHSQKTANGEAVEGLEIVNNIVRHGRGNEGIKVGNSVNALVQKNFIYDIKYGGDAIEAYGVKGFQILNNEINGCGSENGAIYVHNVAGGNPGIVEGNLIKNTYNHFAITLYKGSGNMVINNNRIINAKRGGIFIYKNKSDSAVEGERTNIEITNNTIDGYATYLNSDTSYPSDKPYIPATAAAIAVSFNESSSYGYQPKFLIEGNTTSEGGVDKPVLAFGGGTSTTGALKTDLSLITVSGNTFDKAQDPGIKKFEDKTQGELILGKNTWG